VNSSVPGAGGDIKIGGTGDFDPTRPGSRSDMNLDRIFGAKVPEPFGPLDHSDSAGIAQVFIDTDTDNVLRRIEPVQIDVAESQTFALVFLYQGECRAGHRFVDTKATGQAAGKNGFAGTQVTVQGNHVAAAKSGRQALAEPLSLSVVVGMKHGHMAAGAAALITIAPQQLLKNSISAAE
jgi:hypothetical protein